MLLVMVGSEDPALGALPRLKCSPSAFGGERRWLHGAFFPSSFFLSFPRFGVAPRVGGTDSHALAWPLDVVCICANPLAARAVGLVGRTQWRGEGVLARHSHKGLPSCVGQLVEAQKATRRSRCKTRNGTKRVSASRDCAPHEMVIRIAKRSKRPHRLWHPVGHSLWCWAVPKRSLHSQQPPRQGGVGGYNHRDIGEEQSGDLRCCMLTP